MKLIKRNTEPSTGFDSMLDHFFNDTFLNWPAAPTSNWGKQPAYNIKEEDDHWHVELAVPGMEKSDFKINLENDTLTISTSKSESKHESTDNYKVRQFGYASFTKSFRLPENMINEDEISANYKDGVLYISLPKRDEAKANLKREITIA
jgi:HSP20 family protein